MDQRKHCARCRQFLPVEAFRPTPYDSSGLESWYRECKAEYGREWRAKRRAGFKARKR